MNAPTTLTHLESIPLQRGERKSLPVAKLDLSRHNVRTVTTDVSELAALIQTTGGVLQNLIVHPKLNERGKPSGRYGVVGGGRRLRACQGLIEQGKLPADLEVPVLIIAEADAILMSLAENGGREAMHPVDEFMAFQALAESGQRTETIAAAFGVTPLVVKRRLRLANVAPRFLTLCREGQIDLDILMALAISDDHAQQEAVWEGAQSWERTPNHLRQKLTEREVRSDHRTAKFVGLAAYEAAGGRVRRDLFSDRAYLADPALLTALVQTKIQAEADRLLAEGWAWADCLPEMNYQYREPYQKASTHHDREPTEAEAAALEAIHAEMEMIEQQLTDDESEANDALLARHDALEQQSAAIHDQLRVAQEQDKAQLGVILGLNYDGELEVWTGMQRREALSRKGATGTEGAAASPPKPDHSQSLSLALTAHRTAALQACLIQQPNVALAVVVQAFTLRMFYPGHGTGGLCVSANPPVLTQHAPDIQDSLAMQQLDATRSAWRERLPQQVDQLLGWLLTQTQDELLALLAVVTAPALDAVAYQLDKPVQAELAAAVQLDMADWWQPTADNYFKRVSRERLLAVAQAALPGEAAQRLASISRKSDLVLAAEQAFAGRRWVPEFF